MKLKKSVALDPLIPLFPPTYINNQSRLVITLINESDSIYHFFWRNYSSIQEEENVKSKCDLSDPEQRIKYMTCLDFNSSTFSIDQLQGEIWPHKSSQLLITFCPQKNILYTKTAYLFIAETQERIPYTFQGKGLPPEITLSIQQINIGHVPLNSTYDYQIDIENISQVPLDFSLIERKLSSITFSFTPTSGHLEPNQKLPILIHFAASGIGQFSEIFSYVIDGFPELSTSILFNGKVIGPSVSLNPTYLDFGTVSYGFLYSKTIELENTSDIDMEYHMDFDHNDVFNTREFAITPSDGILKARAKIKVNIELIPISIQNYSVHLILKTGCEVLATLPITATTIELSANTDFPFSSER